MILVFVGAGGSAAVDPELYPTTVEFFNRLPGEIKNDPVFVKVHEFLEERNGKGQPIDIEEVLWNLDELQDYFQISRNTKAIAGWIMAGNRINRLIGNAPDLASLLGGMSQLEPQIQNLKDNINAQVYNFYATNPDPEKLSDWIHLLKELEKIDSAIEIFTTNYDRVLERVISEAGIHVKTGRESDGIQMKLDTALWDTPIESIFDSDRLLTKLHGSVDWQRSNGEIIMSPVFTGNHQNHSILYPGYKGKPDQEPFIKFHEHLQLIVQHADIAIFIGFAFRDGYINSILAELRPEVPKFVINKDDPLPDLPFLKENECEHFNKGLTAEAVEDCLQSLKQANLDKMTIKRVPQ